VCRGAEFFLVLTSAVRLLFLPEIPEPIAQQQSGPYRTAIKGHLHVVGCDEAGRLHSVFAIPLLNLLSKQNL
jgi:hypothetical protein